MRAPAAYSWLMRNDRDWIESRSSEVVNAAPRLRKPRVDWAERDNTLSAQIYRIAGSAEAAGNGRMSVSRVLRMMRAETMVSRNWMKLPHTFHALMLATCNVREWQERRLESAAAKLRLEGRPISVQTLSREARINGAYRVCVRAWLATWTPSAAPCAMKE